MRPCTVKGIPIGGDAPVRIMGVINVSHESFYSDSFVPVPSVHTMATLMIEQGASVIDIGARSTAPNVQQISGKTEVERIDAALKELDGSGIPVSVDTMHPGVLSICLQHDVHMINDIGGLASEAYAKTAAESHLPVIAMAAFSRPGDAVGHAATAKALAEVVTRCEKHKIDNYILDPGVGMWTPIRSVEDDWDLLQHYDAFLSFDRPLLAAISRKTFIGMLLDRPPEDRLSGSLAATFWLLQKGASLVRTHDVAATSDVLRVYERLVKKP
ncbi:MAG TPA: dihydropteroate synthase [Methanoregulaceae archaeon]|nr:dihydropteroate synthase [Methanoregulaceae archaeon]HRY74809.1 dihydropteroate synthase [Methanoregulaceae archaeon]